MCENCTSDEAKMLVDTDIALDEIRTKVRTSIRIDDSVTLHILDSAHSGRIHVIQNVLTQLQENYPAPGKVDVFYPAAMPIEFFPQIDQMEEDVTPQASTMPMLNGKSAFDGPDRVMLLSDVAFSGERSYDGWHMSAHNLIQEGPAVITHEWGHVIDTRSSDFSERVMQFVNAGMMNIFGGMNPRMWYSLSDYGQKNDKEAYAECFSDWAITNGETDNFASRWFAREYNWPVRKLSLPRSHARTHNRNDFYYGYDY